MYQNRMYHKAVKLFIIITFVLMIGGIVFGVKAIIPRIKAFGAMDMATSIMTRVVMSTKMNTYPDNQEAVDTMSFASLDEITYSVDLIEKVHGNLAVAVAYAIEHCDGAIQEPINLSTDYFSTHMDVKEYMKRIYRLERVCFSA